MRGTLTTLFFSSLCVSVQERHSCAIPMARLTFLSPLPQAWAFHECEIAGEGTGFEAEALILIETSNVSFTACLILPLQEADGGNDSVLVHNIFYIGDGGNVNIEDSEVSHMVLHMFVWFVALFRSCLGCMLWKLSL